jgi:membrane protein required for colicin V production
VQNLTLLDNIVLAVMAIAIARGVWIGLIREGFSIAALGGGLIAIRYGLAPASSLLENAAGGRIGSTTSAWIAGVLIGLLVVALVGAVGRILRKGAHAVGLGFADRLAGGVAGAAEGALACAVILLGTTFAIGDDDPMVANSRSMEILEQLQDAVGDADEHLPSVSAPARWLKR